MDANAVELVNLTPNPDLTPSAQVNLGSEFLTWLFWRWERENATFRLEGDLCGLMFEGPLLFAGADMPGCRETVLRHGTPLDTPELGIALWNGKLLRRAKLTFTRGDWIVSATVDGDTFAFRAVKVDPPKQPASPPDAADELPSLKERPAETAGEKRKLGPDERLDRAAFYLDAFLSLYGEFLDLRGDAAKWRAELAKLRPWIAARAGQKA